MNIPGKVLSHLGFNLKVIPRLLTDLSANVGFCTSSPQQGGKYSIHTHDEKNSSTISKTKRKGNNMKK
jgi:hypothetical protein